MRIDEAIPAPPRREPPDYDALNRMVRKHKGALTRAKKKGARAVILAVRDAFDDFDNGMWPDNWPNWTVAFDDAMWELRLEDFDPSDPADAEVLTAVARIEERRP